MAKTLSEVCEELCPGSRKRNWPAWAGEWKHDYETEHYYVEQFGTSWDVHSKADGRLICYRSTKQDAIDFCNGAEANRAESGG